MPLILNRGKTPTPCIEILPSKYFETLETKSYEYTLLNDLIGQSSTPDGHFQPFPNHKVLRKCSKKY